MSAWAIALATCWAHSVDHFSHFRCQASQLGIGFSLSDFTRSHFVSDVRLDICNYRVDNQLHINTLCGRNLRKRLATLHLSLEFCFGQLQDRCNRCNILATTLWSAAHAFATCWAHSVDHFSHFRCQASQLGIGFSLSDFTRSHFVSDVRLDICNYRVDNQLHINTLCGRNLRKRLATLHLSLEFCFGQLQDRCNRCNILATTLWSVINTRH